MRDKHDETRLVAYILGDLDATEASAIETELSSSAEMRAEADAIRETVAALEGALASEGQLALTTAQQTLVMDEATRERAGWVAWFRTRPSLAALSATATVAAIVALTFLLGPGARGPQPPSPRIASTTVSPEPPTSSRPPVARTGGPDSPEVAATPEIAPNPTPSGTPGTISAPVRPTGPARPDRGPVAAPRAPAHAKVRVGGSLRGRVVDETGAVLPGSQVTLKNEESGFTRVTTTDAVGEYFFPAVAPGTYEITAQLEGFNGQTMADIEIPASDMRADLSLGVAGFQDVVTVVGRTPEIQASSGERSFAVEGRGPRPPKPRTRKVNRPIPHTSDHLRPPSGNTEAYDSIRDNPFILVAQDPRSTFSIDVDTASYSNARRFLDGGSLPPRDAVRIEELINYFPHADAPPEGDDPPFAVHLEAATCPWTPDHTLVRIALKGRELSRKQRPPANLVFLLDVSGSMDRPNKLPYVKDAMRLLVAELRPDDRVAIVVYAGEAGVVLPPTLVSNSEAILEALDRLRAGGSTQGSAGIRLAYELAREHFVEEGINRVILATDGDFNVGITNQGDLVRLIKQQAKSGVFLTTLGFGMGNLKDSTLEKLADKGNGNYAYIDTLREARKVLVEQISGTLVTVAKDVKLQLEFNPATVKAFRLIGYENRVLAHQDFADDTKDAGEIGAGQSVTALYEIVPAGSAVSVPGVEPLKYQEPVRPKKDAPTDELLTLKLRYKKRRAWRSKKLEVVLKNRVTPFSKASTDLRFDAAVASFGMLLRSSPYKGHTSYFTTYDWAEAALGPDPGGYRAEFLELIKKAYQLTPED